MLLTNKSVGFVALIAYCLLNTPVFAANTSPIERAMQDVAKANKYALILFYGANDASTQAAYKKLTAESGRRQDFDLLPVQTNDAAEARLIEKFDATRMPLPVIVVVAPNGAVTGVFPKTVSAEQIEAAILTPGCADCIASLQSEKLVFLCVQPNAQNAIPAGVLQFQANPDFADRTKIVHVQANDRAEAKFLTSLGIAPKANDTTTVFMAPPGVLIGKFNSQVTYQVLAGKLAEAGKCCDDPNCQHAAKCCNDPNCKHKSAANKSNNTRSR